MKQLPKLWSGSPSVWIASTNKASVGSRRTTGSSFSNNGPAGSSPKKRITIELWPVMRPKDCSFIQYIAFYLPPSKIEMVFILTRDDMVILTRDGMK